MSRLAAVILLALSLGITLYALDEILSLIDSYAQCVEVCSYLEARSSLDNFCLCGEALETRSK